MSVRMRSGRRTEWLVPVVGVVGRSGVGKTTLLERLVPALGARGVAVGCVKHASHGFLADRPGKDSYRLFESGASAVALISCDQIASFWRRDGEAGRDVSLADAMATLPGGLDLVLAEGFSWEPIPRIAVVPEDEGLAVELVQAGPLLEIVTAPLADRRFPPPFSAALIQRLARRLAARTRLQGRATATLADIAVPATSTH